MLRKSLLSLILMLGSTAWAAVEAPFLTKRQDSGYTLPQHRRVLTCRIFANRVEIERTFGNPAVTAREMRPLSWTGDLAAMIGRASAEKFEPAPTLCDAPGLSIEAHPRGQAADNALLLEARHSCSQDGLRTGENTTVLIHVANSLCGSM